MMPLVGFGLIRVMTGRGVLYRRRIRMEARAKIPTVVVAVRVVKWLPSEMKLAGGAKMSELSHDAFQQQAREYDAVPDVREGLIKLLQMQGTTHPFAVVRFAA